MPRRPARVTRNTPVHSFAVEETIEPPATEPGFIPATRSTDLTQGTCTDPEGTPEYALLAGMQVPDAAGPGRYPNTQAMLDALRSAGVHIPVGITNIPYWAASQPASSMTTAQAVDASRRARIPGLAEAYNTIEQLRHELREERAQREANRQVIVDYNAIIKHVLESTRGYALPSKINRALTRLSDAHTLVATLQAHLDQQGPAVPEEEEI